MSHRGAASLDTPRAPNRVRELLHSQWQTAHIVPHLCGGLAVALDSGFTQPTVTSLCDSLCQSNPYHPTATRLRPWANTPHVHPHVGYGMS